MSRLTVIMTKNHCGNHAGLNTAVQLVAIIAIMKNGEGVHRSSIFEVWVAVI